MTPPVRIGYITPEYPSFGRPDVGLPLYEVCRRIAVPSLIQARVGDTPSLPPPAHAVLDGRRWPDVLLADRTGLALGAAMAGKAIGYGTFFALSARRLAAFRPTVVHLESLMPALHGLFAGHVLRCRLSVAVVGTGLLRLERSRLLQALVRGADVLLPVSAHMVPVLEALAPDARIVVTPPAVDHEMFRPLGLERTCEFLAPAAFRWEKAHDILLDAFARVVARHPQARLALAGQGYLEASTRKRMRALGLERSVSFLGQLSPTDLARRMNTSLASVLSSRYEGSPRVLIESIATGTPIIATRVGGSAAIVGEAGVLVGAEDPVGLAEAMSALIDDPDRRQVYADGCRREAVRFDLEQRAALHAEAWQV